MAIVSVSIMSWDSKIILADKSRNVAEMWYWLRCESTFNTFGYIKVWECFGNRGDYLSESVQ